ncbi:TBC1 domain family member 2B-like, partial [Heteronotia binoei]|uniref:TBC1 domain family member 2B-like n=1 Tax=Heteronotia binoei TaxID=13085 RepID=UPI0029311414
MHLQLIPKRIPGVSGACARGSQQPERACLEASTRKEPFSACWGCPRPKSRLAERGGAGLHFPSGGAAARRRPGLGRMPSAAEAEEGPACRPRLCGYLERLSGKGPLRGFRSRWFVFEPGRCALFYFKGPHERLPLGRLDLARAAFTLPAPPHHAAFEVHAPGAAVTVLKAATQQDMSYWLQELQQRRWEYCNGLDPAQRDGRTSPTPSNFSKGLVAKDNADLSLVPPDASAEKARTVLAVETAPPQLVGEQAASHPIPGQPNALNFALKQWGNEI